MPTDTKVGVRPGSGIESRADPAGHLPKRKIELGFSRGIAILLVMDYHSPKTMLLVAFTHLGFLNFGWCGVDLFFVLSGFLVGGLLIKEWKRYGRIDSKRFLIRRGFKIWPQYYFFLFAILLTGHRSFHSLLGNFLNLQNYMGGVAHTWTLAVEEHAYLLLVAILAVAAWRKMTVRHLFGLLSALALTIVIWKFTFAALGGDVFLRTDTRVDGILYGVLLAMLYHYAPARFARLQSYTWLWAGYLVVAVAIFRVTQQRAWYSLPVQVLTADLMGVAVLLLLYRHREGQVRGALYQGIAWIGVYSYGIYLWHVSAIAPIAALTARGGGRLSLLGQYLGPLVLGIGAGVITTKLVEFPALRVRDRFFPRRVSSAVGAVPVELEDGSGLVSIEPGQG